MCKNIGNVDKVIRLIVGLFIIGGCASEKPARFILKDGLMGDRANPFGLDGDMEQNHFDDDLLVWEDYWYNRYTNDHQNRGVYTHRKSVLIS